MLQLIASNGEGTIQNGTLPIGWCIDKEDIDSLKEKGAKDPYILLVVIHGDYEKSRELVRLDEGMTFVQFYKQGLNTVYGTIVWDNKDGKKGLNTKYLIKEDGYYKTDLTNDNGAFEQPKENCAGNCRIDVSIPEGVFYIPPEWKKKWANMFLENYARNSCSFKKKFLASFVVNSICLAAIAVFLTITTGLKIIMAILATMYGLKGLNYSAILDIKDKDVDEIYKGKKENIFIKKRMDKNGNEYSSYYLLPAAPIFILIVFGSLLACTNITYGYFEVASALVHTPIIIGMLMAGIAIADIINYVMMLRNDPEENIKKYQEDEEFSFLFCEKASVANIDALPSSKRTLKLRYQGLKANLCKPIQE